MRIAQAVEQSLIGDTGTFGMTFGYRIMRRPHHGSASVLSRFCRGMDVLVRYILA